MAVTPESLNNQERGLDLTNRDAGDKKPARRAVLERLKPARVLEPPPGRHWYSAWCQGRDAAVATIEVDGDTARARQLAAPAVIGCADCFRKGRDAVVSLIESA